MAEDVGEGDEEDHYEGHNQWRGLSLAITDWKVWWLAFALLSQVVSLSFNAYFPSKCLSILLPVACDARVLQLWRRPWALNQRPLRCYLLLLPGFLRPSFRSSTLGEANGNHVLIQLIVDSQPCRRHRRTVLAYLHPDPRRHTRIRHLALHYEHSCSLHSAVCR